MIAIFGGTAAYHLNLAEFATVGGNVEALTAFGDVSFVRLTTERGVEVLFLSRHGTGKLARSARFVNHRAHVFGALKLGAMAILSWNGVGAINPELRVGDMVIPDDVMDETRSREVVISNFGLGELGIGNCELGKDRHLVRVPFDKRLRSALIDATIRNSQLAIRNSVYVCAEGPRLETPAEIAAYARLGADIVGMTLCPEVWIAAEVGLPYASLCAVTNMAAGLSHLSAARDFGPGVGARCLRVCLEAAEILD